MMQVQLFTRDGSYVHTVKIPAFQLMPEVLVWGDRTFTLVTDPAWAAKLMPTEARTTYAYREAFAFYVVPIEEG